jgi:hypothetical protein
MPIVDTKDNVFLGEKSFATWHEGLDRYETLPCTRIFPGHGRAGRQGLFAQMREYLTAAKKEHLANGTAEGFVQRMRAAFSSFDGDVLLHHPLRYLFPKSSRSRRTSGRNQPSPKDPGGIDESIDLSRDR